MVQQLDELLFRPGGWFALSRGNQRVPGVVVGSLAAGLELIGHGDVASLVGRLRPGFRVVDIDVEGLPGHAIGEEIAGWCRERGIWVLVRPSGGADGRTHVFAAAEDRVEELAEFLTSVRAAYRVGASRVDLREMVRPLSAPHRTGVETRPLGAVSTALKDLLARTESPPRVATRSAPERRGGVSSTPLVPRPRRRRELPQVWQAFLETGVRPALEQVEGGDYSRSTFEAIATACMVRAGWTAGEAWAVIEGAHPAAMDHARQSRDRWVKHVWNRAVEDDNARALQAVAVDPPAEVAAAVAAARARLRALAWGFPLRQRVSLLRVGHAVLDRLERTGSLRTPVPERDLVLDTGIRDRTTIRTQLRRLDGAVGVLDTAAFDPRSRAGSSFEFEIDQALAEWGGVSQIPPPSCHTPLPAMAPLDLPPTAWLLARVLAGSPERVWSTADLIVECQLGPTLGDELSSGISNRRVREALMALARAGLARCTADGGWVFVTRPGVDLQERPDDWSELVEQVATERANYRTGGTSRWQVARAAAIKRDRARQHAWWAGLDPDEQGHRRTRWARHFDALSVEEQFRFKTEAADRSTTVGVTPAVRHQRWIHEMDPDELMMVAMDRSVRFAALPPPLQIAKVRAWESYRSRFGVPRGSWQIGGRRRSASDSDVAVADVES